MGAAGSAAVGQVGGAGAREAGRNEPGALNADVRSGGKAGQGNRLGRAMRIDGDEAPARFVRGDQLAAVAPERRWRPTIPPSIGGAVRVSVWTCPRQSRANTCVWVPRAPITSSRRSKRPTASNAMPFGVTPAGNPRSGVRGLAGSPPRPPGARPGRGCRPHLCETNNQRPRPGPQRRPRCRARRRRPLDSRPAHERRGLARGRAEAGTAAPPPRR